MMLKTGTEELGRQQVLFQQEWGLEFWIPKTHVKSRQVWWPPQEVLTEETCLASRLTKQTSPGFGETLTPHIR